MLALRGSIRGLLLGAALVSSQSLAAAQDAPANLPPAGPPRVQVPATGAPRSSAVQPPSAALRQAPPTRQAPPAPGGQPAGRVAAPAQQTQQQHMPPRSPQSQPQQQQQQQGPQLSPAEQAELDQILIGWEQQSDKVKTLSTTFTMFEYDAVFGPKGAPGQPPEPKRICEGAIHFAAPDKGSYQITKGGEERWMCDGKAIYEFDAKQRKLKEYQLPVQLQGKAITNGPLPFVFGAKAETMKQRYVMRVLTPPDDKTQILIEAWPRWQQDAANFHHVQVILDKKTMLPSALRLYDPNPQMYKVYAFAESPTVNGTWDQIKNFFSRPTTPLGWQHVVEEPPAEALPPSNPPQVSTADARAKAAPPRPPAIKK